ncbi:MAG: hypothetical protein ACI8UO_001609 [Verrucomicrobiales bacterium]
MECGGELARHRFRALIDIGFNFPKALDQAADDRALESGVSPEAPHRTPKLLAADEIFFHEEHRGSQNRSGRSHRFLHRETERDRLRFSYPRCRNAFEFQGSVIRVESTATVANLRYTLSVIADRESGEQLARIGQ